MADFLEQYFFKPIDHYGLKAIFAYTSVRPASGIRLLARLGILGDDEIKTMPIQAEHLLSQSLLTQSNTLHQAVKSGDLETVKVVASWAKKRGVLKDVLQAKDANGRTVLILSQQYVENNIDLKKKASLTDVCKGRIDFNNKAQQKNLDQRVGQYIGTYFIEKQREILTLLSQETAKIRQHDNLRKKLGG